MPGSASAESTKANLEQRIAQAKDALQRLTDATDFDRQVLLRLGFAYLALSRPWEATLVFRTGLERHGSSPEAPLFLYGLVTARQLAGRPAEAVALGREFFAKYPTAPERLDVALAAGGAALESGDIAAAITFFSGVTADKPAAPDPKAEVAFLQLGHAYFAAGNWSAATAAYTRFHETFPSSKYAEDVDYRSALATLFGGDLKPARKQLEAYLEKYPQAKYEPDARYRLAVCAYGSQEWERALKLTADWQAAFSDNPQLGDVLALRGDVFRSTNRPAEAVDAYRLAVASAGNDQVLSYALNEASTLLEQQRDWPALAALFQDTLAARPGHASSLAWMNGIAKARARLGQFDEAASSLVAFAKSDIARIDNDAVETTLSLIAQLAARTKPAAGGDAAPDSTPPSEPVWETELFAGHSDLIVQARRLYFESELARLRKRPAEAEVEQGSPLAAVPALRRQAALHAPFRHAEGSHWLRAQVAFVRALAGAGLPDEAERELKQLKTGKPPADILPGLELDILLARASAGDWNTFAPRFAALREAGLSEDASARLWLAQAEHDRRRGQPEKALFAFLQVTVFHPRSETAQPAALLGAIRCYRALGETEQARLATEEILRRFADTPEASAASKEIPSV